MKKILILAALPLLGGCMSLADYGADPYARTQVAVGVGGGWGTPGVGWGAPGFGHPGWWGGNVVSVNVFYDSLGGFGRWGAAPGFGRVWFPHHVGPGWSPFWNGVWVNDPRLGRRWVSHDPFGFATDFYGRWHRHPQQGWFWVPGTQFQPAWRAPQGWQPRPANWQPPATLKPPRPFTANFRPDFSRPDYGRPGYGRPGFARPDTDRPRGDRPAFAGRGDGRPGIDRRPEGRPGFARPETDRPRGERPANAGAGQGARTELANRGRGERPVGWQGRPGRGTGEGAAERPTGAPPAGWRGGSRPARTPDAVVAQPVGYAGSNAGQGGPAIASRAPSGRAPSTRAPSGRPAMATTSSPPPAASAPAPSAPAYRTPPPRAERSAPPPRAERVTPPRAERPSSGQRPSGPPARGGSGRGSSGRTNYQ